MIGSPLRLFAALCALIVLSACSNLPRGAAIESEITRNANDPTADFAFYPVTEALLATVAQWPQVNPETSHGWPRARPGSNGQIIAPGDRVDVTIWDSSENSLLVTPGQLVTKLGEMTVSPAGEVFIPYVGKVRVSGMGPGRARAAIQERLLEISPTAQVQLALVEGRLNSVSLVAGVGQPGTYPITDRNTSVLNLIGQAGGVAPTLRNPRVKVQRGSRIYAMSLDRLYRNPGLDAILRGGDKVIVEEDERYFLSLGAAGKEDIYYFEQDRMTALEAIAMIGGIADSRADPEGILILREYPRSALAAGVRGPRKQRVIFSIDLTTADGLFSAKNLKIYPKDVVLATESPVSSIQVALSLVGNAFGLATRLSR